MSKKKEKRKEKNCQLIKLVSEKQQQVRQHKQKSWQRNHKADK